MSDIETVWVPGVPIPEGYGPTYVPPASKASYKSENSTADIIRMHLNECPSDAASMSARIGKRVNTVHQAMNRMLSRGIIEVAGYITNENLRKIRVFRVKEWQ